MSNSNWQDDYRRERAKRIAKLRAETTPLVGGGQGRTSADVIDSSIVVLTCAVLAMLLVLILIATCGGAR